MKKDEEEDPHSKNSIRKMGERKKKLNKMKRRRTLVKGSKRENEQKMVKYYKEEDLHSRNNIRKMGERKKNEREVEKEVAPPWLGCC